MVDLTPQAVNKLIRYCLYKDEEIVDKEGEPPEGAILVEGITRKYGFHPGRIAEKREEIRELLSELPNEFREEMGGGWTFLNACNDRHGKLWTGEHRIMEALFSLGIAAGLAEWLLPREMWTAMPGGVPYIVLKLVKKSSPS